MKLTSAIAFLAAAVATVSADTRGPTTGQDLCCATNQQRAQRGLPALKWIPSIDAMAQRQSEYQRSIGKITHDGPAGPLNKLGGRLQSVGFGYRTAAENVGSGFNNVDAITAAWMNSPGHKANILGASSTVCGGGVADGGYYTVNYASPMDASQNNDFYNLQCSGSKSLGAYTGENPIGHKPQPPAVQPPKPPVQPPAPKPPVVQPPTPKPPVVQPQPPVVGHKPTPQPQPPVQPPVQPQPPVKPPTPGNGKCKLVPKGSIAAGKCKPCKQCGSKPSPFRR
ncbi:hypothetical protein GGH92_007171 [Coemansia sp. RSA 2673]|nr:hypothetical protein GGH92_007171 [Coemansia sp. RSA 2673]